MPNILFLSLSKGYTSNMKKFMKRHYDLDKIETHFSSNIGILDAINYDLIVAQVYHHSIQTAPYGIPKSTPTIFFSDDCTEEDYKYFVEHNVQGFAIGGYAAFVASTIIKGYLDSRFNFLLNNFFTKKHGHILKLNANDFVYTETQGNNCILVMDNVENIIRIPIKKLVNDINLPTVVQIHRRYAINLTKVTKIDLGSNYVQLKSKKIPIGRSFKNELKKKLKELQINI